MIALANDHGAVDMKKQIKSYLEEKGVQCLDLGTDSHESCDYPVCAEQVAAAVSRGECERGILLCGTGVGMAITANKVSGIRAVVCTEPCSAKLSREHNNTNVLCLGARVIGVEMAKMIVDVWLETEFSGDERHCRRIDMISAVESKYRNIDG